MAAGFPYAHRPNRQMSSMVMTTARRPPLAACRPPPAAHRAPRTAHRPAVPPSNHLPPDDLTTPCTAPLLHLATFTRTGDDGLKLSFAAAATLPIHKVVKEPIAIETINAKPTLKAKLVGYAKRISEHHLYEDALLLAIVCSSLLMVGRSWGQDQGRALN